MIKKEKTRRESDYLDDVRAVFDTAIAAARNPVDSDEQHKVLRALKQKTIRLLGLLSKRRLAS